jgi:AraC-like DNA-binding protein
MSTDAAYRPIHRSTFSSRDPEETTEFFRRMYVANHTSFPHVGPEGGCAAESAGAGPMRADRLRGSPLAMHITAGALGYVLVGQLQRGRWTLRSGGTEVRLGPGDTVLYPSDASFQLDAKDFDFNVVSLPLERVAAVAEEHTGIAPGKLRFEAMRPASAGMGRHLARTVELINREFTAPEHDMTHPLVAEALIDTAAAAVLASFPNTSMTGEQPGPGHVSTAALRRAVDYIDEHAGEPITLTDIAAAAGVGPRALQYGFRHRYGTGPNGYLQRARLAGAHAELQAADPTRGATVRDIAAAWGFANPSRFAGRYRQAYGQPPSHTLRG